jgi:hypothetical protein
MAFVLAAFDLSQAVWAPWATLAGSWEQWVRPGKSWFLWSGRPFVFDLYCYLIRPHWGRK